MQARWRRAHTEQVWQNAKDNQRIMVVSLVVALVTLASFAIWLATDAQAMFADHYVGSVFVAWMAVDVVYLLIFRRLWRKQQAIIDRLTLSDK